mgnify:CR=1 FL=1
MSQRDTLVASLRKTALTCSKVGWDGYGARAVSAATLAAALRFVTALPPDLPDPSVVADARGALSFEWYVSVFRLISVGIEPDGSLTWAAILGALCPVGQTGFLDDLPDDLLVLIHRIVDKREYDKP